MNNKKKILIGICAVVVVIAALLCIFLLTRPKTNEGTKKITVEVCDNNGAVKTYTLKTDAEYLRQALDELTKTSDFTLEGSESDYGLYITSVNGLIADYSVDCSYWSILVNGEYGMYGADSQPVTDGDVFRLEYTIATN